MKKVTLTRLRLSQAAKEAAAAIVAASGAAELDRRRRAETAGRAAQRWARWEISNFEYLMQLNTLAGAPFATCNTLSEWCLLGACGGIRAASRHELVACCDMWPAHDLPRAGPVTAVRCARMSPRHLARASCAPAASSMADSPLHLNIPLFFLG